MQKIKFLFALFLAGLVVFACTKEAKEDMDTVVRKAAKEEQQAGQTIPLATDLLQVETVLLAYDQTEAFKQTAQRVTATSRNALPTRVQQAVTDNYPAASIQFYDEYSSLGSGSYRHYSIYLDNGIEFVVFQWGHVMARASIEKEYEPNELRAGQLPWNVLLRTHNNYRNDVIEEIEPAAGGRYTVDLKDGRRLLINNRGTVLSITQDPDGDDDGDGNGNTNTLPGLDDLDNSNSSSSSSSADDDDDGLGDNDDGISGNNDDDDDGDGDNDDGITSNNDDDDDGDGDNDDGINRNNDDDDDGDGDNDDGINRNNDDDDDGDGDNDDGVYSNSDNDDNGNGDDDDGIANNHDDDDDGNGDNDDGIYGNSDDDDDGNGDDDDGIAGNGSYIAPSTLPSTIRNYIAANYPSATIREAEKYTNRYEVELSTGVELYFDLNGNLTGTSGNGSGSGSNDNDDDDDGIYGSSDNDDDDNGSSDNDDDDDNGSSDNDDDDNGSSDNDDDDDNGSSDNDDDDG